MSNPTLIGEKRKRRQNEIQIEVDNKYDDYHSHLPSGKYNLKKDYKNMFGSDLEKAKKCFQTLGNAFLQKLGV